LNLKLQNLEAMLIVSESFNAPEENFPLFIDRYVTVLLFDVNVRVSVPGHLVKTSLSNNAIFCRDRFPHAALYFLKIFVKVLLLG